MLSVLKTVEGNKTKAANVLGIDRVSLWRKLKKYQEG
ncbi:MAG: helix-turn-helix domain-containing protein [Desulfobulbaceae bacterium]|nr:helix-turn-helix domain-containing protein [Desulfobulbaceae bacterium]